MFQCVCLSPIVLAGEWGWLQRGLSFQPPETSPVKRLLCLGVGVIDILPASLSPHIFSLPLLFSLSPFLTSFLCSTVVSSPFSSFSAGVFGRPGSRASGGGRPSRGNDSPAVAPSSAPPAPTCRENRGHRRLQTSLLPVSEALCSVITSVPSPSNEDTGSGNLPVSGYSGEETTVDHLNLIFGGATLH